MSDVLCTRCEACMCDDCRSMVGEYVELFERWRHRAAVLEHQAKEAKVERDDALRQLEHWKAVAVAGVGDIINAWMLATSIERIDRLIKHNDELSVIVAEMDAAAASMDFEKVKRIWEQLEW